MGIMSRLACSACLLAGCLPLACALAAERPPTFTPSDPDHVLEQLPAGYAAAGTTPQRAVSQADVDRMLELAGRSGDARLVSRAALIQDAVVAGGRDTPASLQARAYIARYRHEFGAAAQLLDTAIAMDPRDATARLSRAQMRLVTGDLRGARTDCASLVLADGAAGGFCLAALALRQGDHDAAVRLSDSMSAGQVSGRGATARRAAGSGSGSGIDSAFQRHAGLLGAEAASRAGHADATARFERVLALAPDDVRTLAAFARHLRKAGRPAQVEALLEGAPDTDTLFLERVLAAHALGSPEARSLALAQARRYSNAKAAGIEPELREQALFELAVRDEAGEALRLALANFRDQRDHEDVEILVQAAVAARRLDQLAPLEEWAESQDLRGPLPERDA